MKYFNVILLCFSLDIFASEFFICQSVIVFRSLLELIITRCLNFTVTGGSPAFQCSLCNTGSMDLAAKQCYKNVWSF